MNLIEFTKILSMPSSINKEQTSGLDEIIEDYPYFQSAYFTRLYALKKYRSFRYNDALKKTAAYTTDRTLLFDYITSFDFDLHPAPANLLEETKEDIDEPVERHDKKISQDPVQSEQIESQKDQSVEFKEKEIRAEEQKRGEIGPKEVLNVGHPLDFNRDETYSFGQWLQLSQLKPIERGRQKSTKVSSEKPRSNMDLISDFIAKSPKLSSSLSDSYDDMSHESTQENEQLMTETLAHVYVEQKKYDKAIAAFTILSLKYPEKSSLFADRIEAIRKLQNN